MSTTSQAAVKDLCRQLTQEGFSPLSNPDHLVVGSGGIIWHAVYRHDGIASINYVWDVFPTRDDPAPGQYGRQVAEELRTTDQVVSMMRAERNAAP